MNLSLSCSIVLYKSNQSVKKTILSFLNTSLHPHLYLIDNSPTDNLRFEFADLIKNERVEYIFNNANLGFGTAHNLAIRRALNLSKYHLVLNPDVLFQREVLKDLIKYMDNHEEVGLVTPKVLYPDSRVQYNCNLLPTPLDLLTRRFLPFQFSKKCLTRFEMRETGYNQEFETPYIHGCFMFLRTEALKKVGLFDERFFMYPEDIDLTRRINREYKTMYYPHVSIVHEHAQGSYKSLKLLYIHIVNMIRYFNKWGWFFDKERKEVNKRILAQFK